MKKILALALALMLIMAATAACADGVTLTFFDKNSGTRTFDDPVAMELMKRTGVTIELVAPTGDPGEKLALMLAGLNYPDIVLMDRSSDIVKQYIEAGALVNLSDYMDLMPNVQAMYGETLNKTRYDDGNNYYLSNWYGYDPDPVNGFICRYDYMCEMVGKERADSAEPFTYSEFVQLLRDWKAKHPQIDGKDTIAVELAAPGSGSINGVFSGMNGMYPYYVDENNNLALTVYDPLFLTAIHQMNDLFTEGLMDVEWTSNNSELLQQKLSQNNVFCVAAAYWDCDVASRALMAAGNPDAEYLAYKVVADGVDPDKTTLAGRSSLGWDAIGITTNCENIEAACKFIDYCASQEGQDLLLWGIEGQDWERVNGVRTPIGDIVERWQADSSNTVNQTGICKWTWFVKNSTHEDDGTTNRIWYNEKNRSNRYAYQNLTNSYYDSAVYSALEPSGSTIEALQYQRCIDLFNTAYPKMVNAASQAECDAVYEQLLKDLQGAGVESVQAYMTEQYQTRLELWGLN